MNFHFLLDIVNEAGSFFWIPLLCWFAYFFWCRFLDYPAILEKQIRIGKIWPYLPLFWNKRRKLIRFVSYLLFWTATIGGSCALYYLLANHVASIILGFALSIYIGLKIREISTKNMVRWQQDMYFQIYTQLADQALRKGDEVSNSELSSRAQWQHHNDLRQADKQGRLTEYLKGEAKL